MCEAPRVFGQNGPFVGNGPFLSGYLTIQIYNIIIILEMQIKNSWWNAVLQVRTIIMNSNENVYITKMRIKDLSH